MRDARGTRIYEIVRDYNLIVLLTILGEFSVTFGGHTHTSYSATTKVLTTVQSAFRRLCREEHGRFRCQTENSEKCP